MKTNRGFAPILGIIIAVIVLGGGYYVYQLAGGDVRVNLPPLERGDSDEGGFTTSPKPSTPTEPVACTMEAKICPDGSAVGRTGPKCEFAACPAVKVDVSVNSTVDIKVKNLIEGLYPQEGLPKKAAYLVAELYEEMIDSPQIERDPNRIAQLMNCADLDKIYPALLSAVIGEGPDKTERAKSYFEANKYIKSGPAGGLNQDQACAFIFGDVNNIIPPDFYLMIGQ